MQELPFIFFILGILPLVLFAYASHWFERRRSLRRPVTDKLLRAPGYSLQKKIEALSDRMETTILSAIALPALLVGIVLMPRSPGFMEILIWAILIFFAALMAGIYFTRLLKEKRQHSLGLAGEQAVGQELTELLREGFYVYHDFPTEHGNIDHVLVGPSGVYAVETKTRAKTPGTSSQQGHEVIYDGIALLFPNGRDTEMLKQTELQATWLERFLTSAMGRRVPVMAVLTLPGWYVVQRACSDIPILNPKGLVHLVRKDPARMDSVQVSQIAHQVDRMVRDVEF